MLPKANNQYKVELLVQLNVNWLTPSFVNSNSAVTVGTGVVNIFNIVDAKHDESKNPHQKAEHHKYQPEGTSILVRHPGNLLRTTNMAGVQHWTTGRL